MSIYIINLIVALSTPSDFTFPTLTPGAVQSTDSAGKNGVSTSALVIIIIVKRDQILTDFLN